jgi:hypothetical protein
MPPPRGVLPLTLPSGPVQLDEMADPTNPRPPDVQDGTAHAPHQPRSPSLPTFPKHCFLHLSLASGNPVRVADSVNDNSKMAATATTNNSDNNGSASQARRVQDEPAGAGDSWH